MLERQAGKRFWSGHRVPVLSGTAYRVLSTCSALFSFRFSWGSKVAGVGTGFPRAYLLRAAFCLRVPLERLKNYRGASNICAPAALKEGLQCSFFFLSRCLVLFCVLLFIVFIIC